MGLIKQFHGKTIGVDTSIFIYFIEEHSKYKDILKDFFKENTAGKINIVTASITLLEILVLPFKQARPLSGKKYLDSVPTSRTHPLSIMSILSILSIFLPMLANHQSPITNHQLPITNYPRPLCPLRPLGPHGPLGPPGPQFANNPFIILHFFPIYAIIPPITIFH